MQHEITQIVRYLVTAESQEEALAKWNDHPRTAVIQWQDGDIELFDEEIEVN